MLNEFSHDLIIYTPMYVTAFWTVLLFLPAHTSKYHSRFMLGIFMSTAFILYFTHSLFFHREYIIFLKLEFLYFFASLTVYPLFYWYIRLLSFEPDIKRKNLVLLAPALLFAGSALLLQVMMNEEASFTYFNAILLEQQNPKNLPVLPQLRGYLYYSSRVIFAAQVVFVLIYGRKLVIRYNNRIENFYSSVENKNIHWVKFLLYSFVFTSAMSILFNIIGRSVFIHSAVLLLFPSLIFSTILFVIGYLGYLQKFTVAELYQEEKYVEPETVKDWNYNQLKIKLVDLFVGDKIYKDSNLRITQLSGKLNTNRTYISGIINKEFNLSFNDFVNQYRVNEAKQLLQNSPGKYSLQYISDSTGFGSLNTFIRIFRKFEGITPGKYRDNLLKTK